MSMNHVVEIQNDGYYLKKHRGFLEIYEDNERKAQIVLEDIACLMITAQQATLSKNILLELSKMGIPTLLCGANYMPISMNMNFHLPENALGHPLDQAKASQSLNKRLWQQIIERKIQHQYEVAHDVRFDHPNLPRLKNLITQVKLNDKDNAEAQAARLYFPLLFGDEFLRRPELKGRNSQLNYGYAILRALMARSICAAGLSPALGIFHHNRRNYFCLIDDMMEPFRPLVDYMVCFLEEEEELSKEAKQKLAKLPHMRLPYIPYIRHDDKDKDEKQLRPLHFILQDQAWQLATIYRKAKGSLHIPHFQPDLWKEEMMNESYG